MEFRWLEEIDRTDDVVDHSTTQKERNKPIGDVSDGEALCTPAAKAPAPAQTTPPKDRLTQTEYCTSSHTNVKSQRVYN